MTFMRVSNYASHLRAIQDIKNARDHYADLQMKMSSQKEVNSPKDDPVAMAQILRLDTRISKNKQYIKNIDYSVGVMSTTGSTLNTIEDMLLELKAIAQDHSSSVATSAERASVANTVESMLAGVVQLANSKYLGKFIFGGANTLSGSTSATQTPFVTTTNGSGQITAVTRNTAGIDDLVTREVREGTFEAVNIAGSAPFMPNGESATGDIFQALIDLRDNLNANDVSALEDDIKTIEDAISQVVNEESKLATRENAFGEYKMQLQGINIDYKEQKSHLEDVDYAELIIELNTAESVLQTTLQVSSKLLQISLLNFI